MAQENLTATNPATWPSDELIGYTIDVVYEFARKHSLSQGQAANYLSRFGGLDFLSEFYEVEHTLSFADCVDDLAAICRKNGGML